MDELWSQFAFLMPGLLGDRRGFTAASARRSRRRATRCAAQLVRRIQPFILRRTKAGGRDRTAAEAHHPAAHHLGAGPARTVRDHPRTLHEKVREQMAERRLARSHVIVLDALLKLRQVCCDPRLVKLASARLTESSASSMI